jgi:hypothetical protein
MIDQFGEGTGNLISDISERLGYDNLTPLYVILNTVLDSMIRQDFHLVRNYTVLKGIDKPYAKWPRAFGNAIFIDSKYLLENIIEMIYNNAVNVATRNDPEMNLLL